MSPKNDARDPIVDELLALEDAWKTIKHLSWSGRNRILKHLTDYSDNTMYSESKV